MIFRNQVSEKSRYQAVFLEILDALIQDACVFLDRSTMKEDVFSNFITKVKEKEDIQNLRLEIIRHDKDQEVAQVARFDKFKVVITTIVAVIAALSTLSLWLEPPIRTLINIFF